jgi:hypothetical protein
MLGLLIQRRVQYGRSQVRVLWPMRNFGGQNCRMDGYKHIHVRDIQDVVLINHVID